VASREGLPTCWKMFTKPGMNFGKTNHTASVDANLQTFSLDFFRVILEIIQKSFWLRA
jgi:hypothetical protein